MTNKERTEALEKLKHLQETYSKLKDTLEEVSGQMYQIEKSLGYYAKNEILYGVKYD